MSFVLADFKLTQMFEKFAIFPKIDCRNCRTLLITARIIYYLLPKSVGKQSVIPLLQTHENKRNVL
jgi:hypothetical protein